MPRPAEHAVAERRRAGRALRPAAVAPHARFRRSDADHAGARHRRDDGDVHRDRRRAAEAAALRGAARAGRGVRSDADVEHRALRPAAAGVPRFPRLPDREPHARPRRLALGYGHAQRAGRRRPCRGSQRVGEPVSGVGRTRRARTRLRRGRRPAGRRAGGRHQRPDLAREVRRGAGGDWQSHGARHATLHRRRRHAAPLRDPGRRWRGRLHAARTEHAADPAAARSASDWRDCAAAPGRDAGAGAHGARRHRQPPRGAVSRLQQGPHVCGRAAHAQRRRRRRHAVAALRRGDARPPHRVRQHREPAPRARDVARARAGDARGASARAARVSSASA